MKKSYDVIVLGAGISGLSIARELAKLKQRVLLLEREEPGGRTSRAAAGILDPYTEAEEETPLLRLGIQALDFYPSFIQELGKQVLSEVEYEKLGIIYLALSPEDEKSLKRRFEWQKGKGLPVRWLSRDEVLEKEPDVSPEVRCALLFPEIPKLNAGKLTQALLERTRRSGVEIRSSIGETSVWMEKGRVRGAESSEGRTESPVVVLARGIGEKQVRPVRGQILILSAQPGFEPRHILHTLRYAYIVPWPERQLLVGSTLEVGATEDRVTPEGKEDILNRAVEISEKVRSLPVKTTWAGIRPQAERGTPLIGPARTPGLFLATGYYRSGVLISPLVGKLLAGEIVSGTPSPLLQPFDPEKGGVS